MAVPLFMIISGYVGAMSYYKKETYALGQCFTIKNIISKCVRFLIPFIITYFIEIIVEFFILKNHSLIDLMIMLFTGGKGPGSYYFPVMIQFVFIFPLIYFCILRKGFPGLLLMFLINAAYEFIQSIYGLGESCYRLLVFRYIFVIAFGCYIYLYGNETIKKIYRVLSFIIGVCFIILVEYSSYNPKIIIYWTRTSFVACLYILPIAYNLLRKGSKFHCVPFEMLGKASFNIFLTQMVYYMYAANILYSYISNMYLRIIINIFICCVFGIIFYYVESFITKKIIKRIQASDCILSDRINKIFIKKTV